MSCINCWRCCPAAWPPCRRCGWCFAARPAAWSAWAAMWRVRGRGRVAVAQAAADPRAECGPGPTNRMLAPLAHRRVPVFPACVSRELPPVTGNPVRRELLRPAAHRYDRRPAPLHLLVLGGSLGARPSTRRCRRRCELLQQAATAAEVRHQTGRASRRLPCAGDYRRAACRRAVHRGHGGGVRLGRSGAVPLRRADHCGTVRDGPPAILVPLPHAIDDHQTANARALTGGGGAVLLPQAELTLLRWPTCCGSLLADAGAASGDGRCRARALARPTPRAAWRRPAWRPPMRDRVRRIHLIGIGGSGMSGIAEVLVNLGYRWPAPTCGLSAATERLAARGANGASATRRATSAAPTWWCPPAPCDDNPEVIAARAARIPVVPRAEMLAELMRYGTASPWPAPMARPPPPA